MVVVSRCVRVSVRGVGYFGRKKSEKATKTNRPVLENKVYSSTEVG